MQTCRLTSHHLLRLLTARSGENSAPNYSNSCAKKSQTPGRHRVRFSQATPRTPVTTARCAAAGRPAGVVKNGERNRLCHRVRNYEEDHARCWHTRSYEEEATAGEAACRLSLTVGAWSTHHQVARCGATKCQATASRTCPGADEGQLDRPGPPCRKRRLPPATTPAGFRPMACPRVAVPRAPGSGSWWRFGILQSCRPRFQDLVSPDGKFG